MNKNINKNKIFQDIYNHIDKEEILAKLISDISPNDIHSWLVAKYKGQKDLVISKKNLQTFKDEILDIYSKIRTDILTTQMALMTSNDDTLELVQGNEDYKNKLMEITDKELDIKTIIKQMVIRVESRANQVFELIQSDPRNIKMDRTLVELMNTLLNMLEKFDLIVNPQQQNQINIQNNTINIQVLDDYTNIFHSIIKEILEQLDFETSLLFSELLTKRLSEVKINYEHLLPVDKRLETANIMNDELKLKLDN